MIATGIIEMALHIQVAQELLSTGFDGKRRHADDKFIETVALMQLEDGLGIYVSLTRSRFHLDVKVQRPVLIRLLQLLWAIWHQALLDLYDR